MVSLNKSPKGDIDKIHSDVRDFKVNVFIISIILAISWAFFILAIGFFHSYNSENILDITVHIPKNTSSISALDVSTLADGVEKITDVFVKIIAVVGIVFFLKKAFDYASGKDSIESFFSTAMVLALLLVVPFGMKGMGEISSSMGERQSSDRDVKTALAWLQSGEDFELANDYLKAYFAEDLANYIVVQYKIKHNVNVTNDEKRLLIDSLDTFSPPKSTIYLLSQKIDDVNIKKVANEYEKYFYKSLEYKKQVAFIVGCFFLAVAITSGLVRLKMQFMMRKINQLVVEIENNP